MEDYGPPPASRRDYARLVLVIAAIMAAYHWDKLVHIFEIALAVLWM